MQNIHSTCIIDIGTISTKMGYASTLIPSIFIPTSNASNKYTSPLTYSKITHLDNYNKHLTKHLLALSSQEAIIALNNESRTIKEGIIEYLYENKLIHNLLLHDSNLLNLFSYGKTTGIVINLSESINIVCIVNGLIIDRRDFEFGGKNISKMFMKPINGNEYDEYLIYEKIHGLKELVFSGSDTCLDYEMEKKMAIDGLICNISTSVKEIVESCEEENKYLLLSNIVLAGGCSRIWKIDELINEEVCKVFPQPKVKVICENIFHTFSGGAVFGSLGNTKPFFIGERDYDEYGPNILDRKNMIWSIK